MGRRTPAVHVIPGSRHLLACPEKLCNVRLKNNVCCWRQGGVEDAGSCVCVQTAYTVLDLLTVSIATCCRSLVPLILAVLVECVSGSWKQHRQHHERPE